MNQTVTQSLENLPDEILALPRFLRTREDNHKAPLVKEWQNPKNQKLYSELKGIVGFVAATDNDDSLIFFDFDHALDDNGKFVNETAEKWFYTLRGGEFYCELSQSGRGLHMFAQPTKGKFSKLNGKIYFDDEKKSFLEIFYGTTKFCLVTGNLFRCNPNTPIATLDAADAIFQTVLDEIKQKVIPPSNASSPRNIFYTEKSQTPPRRLPPRDYQGDKYFTEAQIAEIMGVYKSTVQKWRKQRFFVEDIRDHDGTFLYLAERVYQLKSVYRRDWQKAWRGGEPSTDTLEYDLWRAEKMLDVINPAELSDSDWLAVISACKNIGLSYAVVDAFNRRDSARYNETENLARWNSANDPSFNIETLHGIAKRFDYTEKDTQTEWYQLNPELNKRTAPAPMNDDAETKNETRGTDTFNGYNYLQGDSDDLPNARRLEKFRGKYFRWLADDERWLTYYNGVWLRRSEKNSVLYPIAAQFSDEMFNFAKILAANFEKMKPPTIIHKNYADKTPEEKAYDKAKSDKDKTFRVAGYFQKRKNYSAAIELLKSCSSILVTNADLNGHKNLLCCADCVVDLQTGITYDFAPDFLITNQTNAAYQKYISDEADAFVKKVIADILPDEATRRAVLRYLGYCLTGERNFQVSQFWRGSGANGKSTVLDTLVLLLGSYVVKLPCAALLASSKPADGNAATPALALLDGDKRTAIVDELPQKCRLDAGFFKSLVTDKTMAGRPLYGNFRNIELRAKLILNGNFLPQFSANDKAMRRRINTVEFTQCFEGDRADKNLLSKLAEPSALCAFLRILVAEAIEFYRDGLLESDAMKQTKAEYISESDFIGAFATDNCDIGDGYILRKDFETRLKSEYPAETSLFTKNQLFKAIVESLKPLGVEYTKDRLKNNIFKGISWQQAADDFSGEIISSAEYAMP